MPITLPPCSSFTLRSLFALPLRQKEHLILWEGLWRSRWESKKKFQTHFDCTDRSGFELQPPTWLNSQTLWHPTVEGPVEAGQEQADKGDQGSHEAQQWEDRKQLLNHWSCSLKRWAVRQQLHKPNPQPRGWLTTTTAFTADLKGGSIHTSCLLTYKTVKMRVNLPSIQDLRSRLRKQGADVSADPGHPRHKLFKLVPSVICYKVLLTKTSRHRDSFFSTGCDSCKHWKWHDTHSLLPVCTVVSS